MIPTSERTWILHHESPYGGSSPVKDLGPGNIFDVVNCISIPEQDGKSTSERIKAVNRNLSMLNPAYDSIDSMTAALNQLTQKDIKYEALPIILARMMHLTGSGVNIKTSCAGSETRC
jgi:hypothetical protein